MDAMIWDIPPEIMMASNPRTAYWKRLFDEAMWS
jgi:hypothetical protein